ncbi:hypothetical protein [Pseudomonas sp. NA-150]|uniref:hypothetical protein n=1 Tax=Pseudomonas sp. NA-150 TaxID=3367525 RepID=UPI0037C7A59D
MRLRKKKFYAVSFLFALAGALIVWQLCLIGRQPGPFGYGEAAIQTMRGKLVYAIVPGRRQIQVAQYLFEDTETGKLKKFYDLFTSDSIRFDRDKGKVFELSVINDQILSCGLDGQQFCFAKCGSAPQCEARMVIFEAAREDQSWWNLLNCLIVLCFLYFWKVWRNRPLHQATSIP